MQHHKSMEFSKTEPQSLSTDHRVLWVDDDLLTLDAARRFARTVSWKIEFASHPEEVFRKISTSSFSVIVSDQRMPSLSGVDLLSLVKDQYPHITRILLTGQLDSELVSEAVNRAGVFRFVLKPWETAELTADLSAAIQHHVDLVVQQKLRREMIQKNQTLEELRSGLEALVAERTQKIELSKVELERKQNLIRSVVRFVTELSQVDTVIELMSILRREMRRLHETFEPIIFFPDEAGRGHLIYFRGSGVFRKDIFRDQLSQKGFAGGPESVANLGGERVNSSEDRQTLATLLGRPIGPLITLPMTELSAFAGPLLFVENRVPDKVLRFHLSRLRDLISPLKIALDRIYLGDQMKVAALQWEKTFDAIPDPIAIVGRDFQILRANRHFLKESSSSICSQTFAQAEKACEGCPLPDALKSGLPAQGQIRVGGNFYEVYSYPVHFHESGGASTVVNHYVDISEKKYLYGRMIQNEKMAALGSLAGNIAHELNNPLTGIRSLAQIVATEEFDENLTKDLREIEQASQRCQAIISNLLSFSRSKGLGLSQSLLSVNDVVEKTIPLLKTAMKFHNREMYLSQEQIFVRGEFGLLQQVVFNIVQNACQSMSEPGVITIETERVGDFAEIRVYDTGVGISSENLKRIFESFFTTKSEIEGTGLGLSVSQGIVESFGGEILVKSELNKGSCFTIRLPMVRQGKP